MRLDKYLKVSRLIKRRTLAKEVSEAKRVLVNNQIAKPSKELKIDDVLEIVFGKKRLIVKVKSLKPVVKKEEATEMYELIDEITIN